MRATIIASVTAVFLLTATAANAAPPATPHVTIGAEIKKLIFDWDSVTGAGYYRLMVKIGSGAYKPLIDNIPASTTQVKLSISVHLLPWTLTHYSVAACNSSGCTNSADISPQNLMLDAIGYFKASNPDPADNFGSVVLSDDGRTLAVGAPNEASDATGVNGNWGNNNSRWSGAVYVFRRTSSGWRQVAYLKAGVNQTNQFFGSALLAFEKALAINYNGTMIAVGAPFQNASGLLEPGVVYVYQKAASGTWSLTDTLMSPRPQTNGNFGTSLDMSIDGRTLKVNSYVPEVSTHIFIRPGSTWQHSVELAPFFAGDDCRVVRLSRDGNTLVSSCENQSTGLARLETRKRSGNTWTHVADQPLTTQASAMGLALDFNASTMALQETQQRTVALLRWNGSGWVRERTFVQPDVPSLPIFSFGTSLALSRTGDVLAIANAEVAEDGAGVSPISMPGTQMRGAVYLWRRDAHLTWVLRSIVKAAIPTNTNSMLFGNSIDMCGNGNALVVGEPLDYSSARGVGGDRTNTSKPGAGAAYLY